MAVGEGCVVVTTWCRVDFVGGPGAEPPAKIAFLEPFYDSWGVEKGVSAFSARESPPG